MTRFLHLLVSIGYSSIFFSCQAQTQPLYTPPSFAVDTYIKGQILHDSLYLRTANDIAVGNGYLYVAGFSANQWLHIYEQKTGRPIRSCIPLGKGPGEMLFTETVETTPAGHVVLWNPDASKRGFYNIDSLLAGNGGWIVKEDVLSFPNDFGARYINRRGTNSWLYTGHNAWHRQPTMRFKLYQDSTETATYDLYPVDSTSEDFWGFWRSATTYAKIAVSPDGTKMAHGLLFGCVLETFDLSGDAIRPIAIRRFYKPDMIRDLGVRGTDDTHLGFTHLTATDRRIFGIYVDQVSSEADNSPNSIVVFDWEGNPLARYRTDYCLVALVAAPEKPDTDETEIFAVGVSPDDGEWKLVRFPIPD